jgi:uncharacterized protein (UPF0147 family)
MDESDIINFNLGAVSGMELENVEGDVEIEWDDVSDETILQMMSLLDNVIEDTTAGVTTAAEPAGEEATVTATDKPVASSSKFATLTEADIIKIEEGKDEKSTKSSTNWGVKRLKG